MKTGSATPRGGFAPVPAEEEWQPHLWREILADLPEDQRPFHRAALHERFLEALARADQRAAGLPRRILVFGISSLPQQMLCDQEEARNLGAFLLEQGQGRDRGGAVRGLAGSGTQR